jgi:hypothetical protein
VYRYGALISIQGICISRVASNYLCICCFSSIGLAAPSSLFAGLELGVAPGYKGTISCALMITGNKNRNEKRRCGAFILFYYKHLQSLAYYVELELYEFSRKGKQVGLASLLLVFFFA